MSLNIAVLLPCYNEEQTIGDVVKQFQIALPEAKIYVYDNNSSDKTSEVALKAGAIVRSVLQKGKGSVVKRMFADIDADVYVMADGDLTYDISKAPLLIETLVKQQKDMVVGTRVEQAKKAYPFAHKFGNMFLTCLVRAMFGLRQTDMLSGFRAFSKRFVKTFPAESKGFEIETELNIFTSIYELPFGEVKTDYFERPEGSKSKLSTIKDGFKILFVILKNFVNNFPFRISLLFSFLLAFEGLNDIYSESNQAYIFFFAFAALFCGVYLNKIRKQRRVGTRLFYLTYPFPSENDL